MLHMDFHILLHRSSYILGLVHHYILIHHHTVQKYLLRLLHNYSDTGMNRDYISPQYHKIVTVLHILLKAQAQEHYSHMFLLLLQFIYHKFVFDQDYLYL